MRPGAVTIGSCRIRLRVLDEILGVFYSDFSSSVGIYFPIKRILYHSFPSKARRAVRLLIYEIVSDDTSPEWYREKRYYTRVEVLELYPDH